MTARPRRIAVALLAALLAAGCGAGARAGAGSASAPAEDSREELEALFRERRASDRSRFTEADVRFMNAMIGHHAQALVMASLAPTHGASPAVRTLAARIDNAQRDEIATMQQWLRERGQPVPEIHIEGTELMIHGGGHTGHEGHDALMPGMLTPEQLRALDAARGEAFDRLFLASMIEHHRGAVSMVRELFATDGAGQDEGVFRFATDVQVDQITEINRMELMLSAMGAERPRQ